MKYLLALLILSSTLFFSSCNKYEGMKRASIYDTGNLSIDGCGYLFKLEDGTYEMPISLPSSYRHHGLEVWVKYKASGNVVTCKMDQTNKKAYDQVEIEEIQRYLD